MLPWLDKFRRSFRLVLDTSVCGLTSKTSRGTRNSYLWAVLIGLSLGPTPNSALAQQNDAGQITHVIRLVEVASAKDPGRWNNVTTNFPYSLKRQDELRTRQASSA